MMDAKDARDAMDASLYQDLIGIPYRDGGRYPGQPSPYSSSLTPHCAGLDCWGLVIEIFRRLGLEIRDFSKAEALVQQTQYRSAEDWRAALFGHWHVSEPMAGTIIVFANVEGQAVHAGVIISQRDFIHATRKSGTTLERLDRAPWTTTVMGIYAPRS